ncbi:MAG: SDR family oxidoreductase [Bryobacteraceae bacterium]
MGDSGPVLVAGATGALGRHVIAVLRRREYRIRCLSRRAQEGPCWAEMRNADLRDRASLAGVCQGVEAVISCAGASLRLDFRDRTGFREIDAAGNANLLEEARRSGVRKFVYVSLAGGGELRRTEYADAHEWFVERLAESGMAHAVVRPTGFFNIFGEILEMARKGRAVVIGPGEARTNPIHPADVARACVEALEGEAAELVIGGPEIFTRREIVELACSIAETSPRIVHVSPKLMRAATAPLALLQPRLHALMRFGIEVSLRDVLAPAYGAQALGDYFRSISRSA